MGFQLVRQVVALRSGLYDLSNYLVGDSGYGASVWHLGQRGQNTSIGCCSFGSKCDLDEMSKLSDIHQRIIIAAAIALLGLSIFAAVVFNCFAERLRRIGTDTSLGV